MYIQITTRCNMSCAHCCFSCAPNKGKHMQADVLQRALWLAQNYGTEFMTIGGGEPTLHPDFFGILGKCLNRFDNTWLATNGSNTEAMFRLANIMKGEDWPECTCGHPDDDCSCTNEGLYGVDKLSVALSQDYWHDPIDSRVVDLWKRNKLEIRNVSESYTGAAAQGRAKISGAGWSNHCVCSDHIIRPDGKIKLCGCTHSPIIGDVWKGISSTWEQKLHDNEEFQDSRCYKAFKK